MTYGRPDPYPPPLTLRDAPRTGLLTNQTDAEPLPSGDLDQRKTQWLAIESHADAAEGLLETFSQLGIIQVLGRSRTLQKGKRKRRSIGQVCATKNATNRCYKSPFRRPCKQLIYKGFYSMAER